MIIVNILALVPAVRVVAIVTLVTEVILMTAVAVTILKVLTVQYYNHLLRVSVIKGVTPSSFN